MGGEEASRARIYNAATNVLINLTLCLLYADCVIYGAIKGRKSLQCLTYWLYVCHENQAAPSNIGFVKYADENFLTMLTFHCSHQFVIQQHHNIPDL